MKKHTIKINEAKLTKTISDKIQMLFEGYEDDDFSSVYNEPVRRNASIPDFGEQDAMYVEISNQLREALDKTNNALMMIQKMKKQHPGEDMFAIRQSYGSVLDAKEKLNYAVKTLGMFRFGNQK